MSRQFKSYMGKNTFGVLKESQEAGKYTLNKKALASFCPPKICISKETQSNRLLLRQANRIYYSSCHNPYNKANLNINLVTILDLSGVPVIQQNNPYTIPAELDVTLKPYIAYTIDPSGNLFGNTVCGTDNFQKYLLFNPPYKTANPGNIGTL